MQYQLITTYEIEELSGLSADEAFATFEGICRNRLHEFARQLDQNDNGQDLYLEYMSVISAAAEAYQVEGYGLLTVPETDFVFESYRIFSQRVLKAVTQSKIRSARKTRNESVGLEQSDKEKILHHVRQLKSRIDESTLDDTQKKTLLKKLEALEFELADKRLSLSRTMVLLAAFFATINQAESAAIKAPEALAAIMQVVGSVIGGEEGKSSLPPPQKHLVIEDKRDAESKRPLPSKAPDDEIPF